MEQSNNTTDKPDFLEFMPVGIFGGVMALSALCFAWRIACQTWHLDSLIPEVIGGAAILSFILLTIAYISKWLRYPGAVRTEFENPVTVGFYSTVIISLLLMPGIILPYAPMAADVLWLFGVAMTFLFGWFVLRKWMNRQQLPESAMPVWVLPVTGTLNVPIVGNSLKFAGAHEICLMFFGIGILFIIIMMGIIISRLFFQAPLPVSVQPSLLILAAPFALAFNSYEGLSHAQDIAASSFFYFTLFLLVIFGSKIVLLPRTCPFQVSWWSVSFPLAAISIASLRYAKNQQDTAHWVFASALLTVTTLVILYLILQTIHQIWSGRFGHGGKATAFHGPISSVLKPTL